MTTMAMSIQWVRSMIPTNSLACVNALAHDAARRSVLGSDVAIDITPIDECHTRVRCKDIIKQFREHGNFGLVGLVGVQSNQFPRAIDIARPLREAGIQVAIGGFHVSGCLAMLPELPADLQGALDHGLQPVRRRSRGGPARPRAPGRRRRPPAAGLQFHEGAAGARRLAVADPSAGNVEAHHQLLRQL